MKTSLDFGGKANSLFILTELGFNVPPFKAIKHDDPALLDRELLADIVRSLPGDYFAVRSSANMEDGVDHSFAGVFTSKIFVAREKVIDAVAEVLESLESPSLKAYLSAHRLDKESIELNVIIQVMMDSDVSGVAFSLDPNKPYLQSPLISAAHGLGQALVDGSISGDEFRFLNGSWKVVKGGQERQLIFCESMGLKHQTLTHDSSNTPVLSEKQCNQLKEVIERIKDHSGGEVDIEFCYCDQELYILQSRPVTALRSIEDHVIWDNSNIVESYPGVTSPFTYSFILPIYSAVYRNFCALLGVPQNVINLNSSVFDQMLGHIRGRVYYHLINWYKALAMLPAYQINAAFMEKMMGVSIPLKLSISIENPNPKWKTYYHVLRTVFRLIILNFTLPRLKRRFNEDTGRVLIEFKGKDYYSEDEKRIWKEYMSFKNVLVNKWNAPLINDFFAMIYFGVLERLCKKWLNNESLHTRLISGRMSVISVQPAYAIEKIIYTAKREGYWQGLLSGPSNKIWQSCVDGDMGETGKLIQDYIDRFGSRSIGELKIESLTFATHPEMFIDVLKSYKNTSPVHHDADVKPEVRLRLSWWKKLIFSFVLKKARETVGDRENLRYVRTLAFGVVRRLIRTVGQRLKERSIIDRVDEVFYFTEEDLSRVVNEDVKQGEARSLLASRKREWKEFEKIEGLPERIHQVDGYLDLDIDDGFTFDQDLKGIPCSPGIVRGRTRVLETADSVESLEGDILVTTSTDPGWITIFRSASAILVERGSTLSHAAIVSREMGIPCIVGIKGLTKKLRTGDRIELNANTGFVKILS